MLDKLILYSFYLLFFLTPLVWSPSNFELFEFNKMMLVYTLAILITSCFLLKTIQTRQLVYRKTPLNLPLMLFLAANILSTVFSIDKHLSFWGYYSRLNGGLASITSYTLLYFILTASLTKEQAKNCLKAAFFGGVVVALYAIPEHFGVSPSCILLSGRFTVDCWVQDVQARVFATLGQPNWLAAYLVMLIFPGFYFYLSAKHKFNALAYLLLASSCFLAFTFTYSRSATLGLGLGLAFFIPWAIIKIHYRNRWHFSLLASLLLISLFFGTALTSFKIISKFSPPARPSISRNPAGSMLESGGTESGQIRLIVWQGAWNIFKAYPIFGSGVETFAESYYKFRPVGHNLVSEWDFLYNKAHNEYLNYLANTGIVGLSTYLLIIGVFLAWSFQNLVRRKSTKINPDQALMLLALTCGYLANLITNFFGFSVVVTNLLFFLFPGLAFLYSHTSLQTQSFSFANFKYIRVLPIILTAIVCTLGVTLFIKISLNYAADTIFAQGYKLNDSSLSTSAYNSYLTATLLNPDEPFYQIELGNAAAASAIIYQEKDSSNSARLAKKAASVSQKVLNQYPNNSSFYRTAIRTFFLLSDFDPQYKQKTLEVVDDAVALAPTDAKLRYNKALVLGEFGKKEAAVQTLQKTLELKPNYREARYSLALYLNELGQKDQAVAELQTILKFIPNDQEVVEKLKSWSK